MRGDITAALLHDPEILYLDEPTIGLDVVSKGRLREFLRALNQERGTTLLLTTHDLQDIEALCRRVIVIDHGTAVFDGALDDLHRHGGSTRTLVVDLVDEAPPISIPGADDPAGRGAAPVAQLPGRRQRGARSSPPWPRRTTSPTCPSTSPPSRTSSATCTAPRHGPTFPESLQNDRWEGGYAPDEPSTVDPQE